MELDPEKVVSTLKANLGDSTNITYCDFCHLLEQMDPDSINPRFSGCLIIHNFLENFNAAHLTLDELIDLVNQSLLLPDCENEMLLRQFKGVYHLFERNNQLNILEQLLKE